MAVDKGLYGSSQLNSSTAELYNLPTINVVRSGTVSIAEASCLNLIGPFNVVMDTTDAPSPKNIFIINTGMSGASSVSGNNGALIDGNPSVQVAAGAILRLTFDGTNFSS